MTTASKRSVICVNEELVRVTRSLASDPSLVIHGGGNSSEKSLRTDIADGDVEVLVVKGSGSDMAQASADSFTALRLSRLRALLDAPLTDDALMSELCGAKFDPEDPDPSVETLVHALLPHRFVLHSHSDAVLALTNSPRAAELDLPHVLIVDYEMPGVDLARAIRAAWTENGSDAIQGIVVLKHGIFTFAESAQEALDRHLDIVSFAQTHAALPEHLESQAAEPVDALAVAQLRARIADVAGVPVLARRHGDARSAAFARNPALQDAALRGPVTPDHVIWTKQRPMVGLDVAAFATSYREYVGRNRTRHKRKLVEIDAAPRVILSDLGLITSGLDARSLTATSEVYAHTMDVIEAAEALGGYDPADENHIFDLEYWAPQQQKLHRRTSRRPLTGHVALVTGAASGIGQACAHAYLEAGAAVIGWDLSPAVETAFDGPAWLGQRVDVTDDEAMKTALSEAICHFGGLDILVVSAGIFPKSADIADLDMETWRRTLGVNVDSVASLYGLTVPYLAEACGGGRVVVIASKNVLAPGRGAAAYSSSKAALTQLSRVAALEWAELGIRVNLIHPDAVFDTGLWTPELLATRAAHYGLSVDDYKRRNLLKAEVTSRTVASMAVTMASEAFSCTTGAQVAVDGGSDRTI